MKTVKVNTSADNAHGKAIKDFAVNDENGKLVESVPYTFSFQELEKGDEIPAKELPDSDDILKLVNNKRKANARQAELAKALDKAGIKKPDMKTDFDERVRRFVPILVAQGMSEADAKTFAENTLRAAAAQSGEQI